MIDLNYDPDRPLYIPSGERMSIDQSRNVIEKAYSTGKPVLIYIHGRAKGVGEPKKSVSKKIYKGLEKYDVSVIGFTWDADDGGYDETRPQASADDFDRFLDALADFLSSGDGVGKDKPALLAHSMGNIIVSELAKDKKLESERGKLFTNIILNAAAVKTKRHHRWLNKIKASDHTYVMVNPNDRVLQFAGALFKPNMLGKEVREPGVSDNVAVYVYLGYLDVNHRYFVPSKQNGQANLKSFYEQVITGAAVNLGTISESKTIDGINMQAILSD